jgi:hypothetical protein
MRFARDPFVVERHYRLDPSLLKEGAVPDAEELTVLVPLRGLGAEFGDALIFLSDVTLHVWQLLTSGASTDEVAAALVAEYDVDPARAEADVAALVRELCEKRALVELQGRGTLGGRGGLGP